MRAVDWYQVKALWPKVDRVMARQSCENGHFQRALKSCSGHFRLKILAASCSSHFFEQDKRTPGACRSFSKTGEAFKVVKCHVTAARVSARGARIVARSVT